MKKHSTLLALAVIGIFMITSCGFQQRKYTHGHYRDCCKDPTSTVISPSLSAMTEIPCIDFLEGNQVSKPMMDDLSSSVLATDQDSGEKQNRSMESEIVGDTTIKGSKGNRVDLPNQSETRRFWKSILKNQKSTPIDILELQGCCLLRWWGCRLPSLNHQVSIPHPCI
jgi:hypothetical protein